MPPGDEHVFTAARAGERGLPRIEFRFRSSDGLQVSEVDPATLGGGAVISCEERGASGRLVGTIEIGLFGASLIIDRSGVLRDLAQAGVESALAATARAQLLGEGEVELAGGASGYRIDALLQLDDEGHVRPELPYASWLALAGGDPVLRGGLVK